MSKRQLSRRDSLITANRYAVFGADDENALKLFSDDSCTTLTILRTSDIYTVKGEYYGVGITSKCKKKRFSTR